MAFPATCTLIGTYNDASGGTAHGQLTITPTAELVDSGGQVIVPQIPITVPLVNGAFSTPLVPTDTAGLSPTGWSYQVVEQITYPGRGAVSATYYIKPTGTGTISIDTLAQYNPAPAVTAYGSLAGTNTWTGGNTFQGATTLSGPVTADGGLTAAYALGDFTPANHGLAAWAYDVSLAFNSATLTSGELYLVRINAAETTTVTTIYWWLTSPGSGPTAGQNWAGIYDHTGTLLASAGVDATVTGTAGPQTATITATTITAGQFYWVALLFNATGPPTLARGTGTSGASAALNLNLGPSAYRYATAGASLTAFPPSITPSANSPLNFAGPWCAVG